MEERTLSVASERMRRSGFGPGKNGRPRKAAETSTPPRPRVSRTSATVPVAPSPPLPAPEPPASTIEPRLLSSAEACVYLRCSNQTLRDLARRGAILVVRFGATAMLRFDRHDLDRLIESWKMRFVPRVSLVRRGRHAEQLTSDSSNGRPSDGAPTTSRDDSR